MPGVPTPLPPPCLCCCAALNGMTARIRTYTEYGGMEGRTVVCWILVIHGRRHVHFYRASEHMTRDIDIAILSLRPTVCLSVCLSITCWYCMKMAEHIVIVFSPYGSTIILVLPPSNIVNSDGVTPYGGAKYTSCIKISRFSTNKSLYLANDTKYGHSYYGRQIWTRRYLSNGAISNDFERTLTLFSRSHHSLMLNISQKATDTAIVTIEGE